jgi:hypothetical protein
MGRLAALVMFLLVVAVVVLALQAPASWLAQRLSLATGDAVRVIEPQGTIWDGRGVLTSPDGRWRIPVSWHLKAGPLVRGEVELELEPQSGRDTPRGTLRITRTGVAAQGLVLDLPATVLDSAFRGGRPLAFGGDLRVESPAIVLEASGGSGRLAVRWDRARMAAADGSSLSLGTVSGDFAPRDGGLAGRIVGDGGDASIDGEMSLGARGIALDARLAPRPGAGDGVTRVLSALGQPDANGAVRLQWLSANR